MDAVLYSTLLSFGVIFVAELGDKSQLMALTFATRFRVGRSSSASPSPPRSCTWCPSASASVWAPRCPPAGSISPPRWPSSRSASGPCAATRLTDDEQDKVNRVGKRAVIAVGTAFFLAELGDKTMLATITLATDHGWFGTWLGSTLGMVAADALAIVVGRALGKRLPEKTIAYGAAALFFLFGIWLGIEAIAQLT